jgi:hypothetical protein
MHALPIDPAKANRLMLALGGIVLQFGLFEVFLQSAIVVIHHGVDRRESGKGSGNKSLPRDMLSEGIRFMRDSVGFEGMGHFADDIRRVMDVAGRLASRRNHIVHGHFSEFIEDTETAVFLKFKVDRSDDIYSGSHLEITLAELEMLRDEATDLKNEMMKLATGLTEVIFDSDTKLILDFSESDPRPQE